MKKLPKYLGLKILSASVILIPVVFCNKISDLESSKSVSKIENNQLVEYKNNSRYQNQNMEFFIKNAKFNYLQGDKWNNEAAVFRTYWYFWDDDFIQSLREQEVSVTNDLLSPLESKLIGNSTSGFKLKVKPNNDYFLKWDFSPGNQSTDLSSSSPIYKEASQNWENKIPNNSRGNIKWSNNWIVNKYYIDEKIFDIDYLWSSKYNIKKIEAAGSTEPDFGKDIGFLFYKIYLDISEDYYGKIQVVLKQRTFLNLFDKWWAEDPTSTIYLPLDQSLDFYYVAPYTEADLREFASNFLNLVTRDIVFYSDDIEVYSKKNFEKIKEILKKRVDNFYASQKVKNSKLGTINRQTTEIIYENILASEQDRTLSATHQIRFNLLNNDTFSLFNNLSGFDKKSSSGLVKNINIQIQLIGNNQESPEKLISIIPNSVSELNNKYFHKNNPLFDNYKISSAPPNWDGDIVFSSFDINLNTKNATGDFSLVPKNKIPLILRYGLKLNFDLIISDEQRNIVDDSYEIKFLYNNDSSNFELKLPNFSIHQNYYNNNILKFKLNFEDNRLMLSSSENDNILSPTNTWPTAQYANLFLKMNNLRASLPSDQSSKKASWKLIEHKEATGTKPKTDKYSTEEPFIFKMLFSPIAPNSTAARYVPFIDGVQIGLSNSTELDENKKEIKCFKSDLNLYLLSKKDEGEINIKIEIKEFDEKSNDYSKVVYVLEVVAKIGQEPLLFELKGWNSEILTKEDKAKYFNPDDKQNYRGDKIDEKTGMYKPKLVWVNSIPPKTFLYDPLNEKGEKIEALGDSLNYDIGYLAQINTNGFKDGDFNSMPTIGGYSITYPTNYIPNGEYPYSEIYDFSKGNNFYPAVNKESLTNNKLTFSSKGLRQTILKKNSSDSFMYQFILSSDQIVKQNDKNENEVIDIFNHYKKFKNEKNELIFQDFWSTYHGDNLANYLINSGIITKKIEAAEMSYSEVNQYWNAYVAKMTRVVNNVSFSTDLSTLNLDKIFLSSKDRSELILELRKQINSQLVKYTKSNVVENIDYRIEADEQSFNKKILELIKNYEIDDAEKATIKFNVYSINTSLYLRNNCRFFVLNSKHKPYDLSVINGFAIKFNSEDKNNFSPDKFEYIKNVLIYDQIRIELKKETNIEDLQLYVDYTLEFYTTIIDSHGAYKEFQFKNIDDAINNGLLINTENKDFDNTIFIKIRAANTLDSYKLTNSYDKKYNNSSKNTNNNLLKETYNLAKLNSELKFNSESKNFPLGDKKSFLINYIKEWVQKHIQSFVNKINQYELRIALNEKDYLISSLDFNTLEIAIENLISNISDPKNFDKTINLKISSINKEFLENSFSLIINNSSKNKALPDIQNNDSNTNQDSQKDELYPSVEKNDFFDSAANQESFWSQNMIWILTLSSALIIATIATASIYKLRKNRKIR